MHSQFITFQNPGTQVRRTEWFPRRRSNGEANWEPEEENLAYQDLLKCANCARKLKNIYIREKRSVTDLSPFFSRRHSLLV